MTELTCRKLRPGESGLYRALRLDSLKRCPESFGSTYAEETRAPRLVFESAIEEGTPDRFMVGAFSGKRLVGIAGFARHERSKMRHRGEITQVYVDPDQRGRALGRTLLRAAVEMAFVLRGIEQVELSVVATNAAALRLYANLGFEKSPCMRITSRSAISAGTGASCSSRARGTSVEPASRHRKGVRVLELRPTCENCNKALPPNSLQARICTYECTFCATCVENVLGNVCPNCGGGFVPRPIRPSKNWKGDNFLGKDPPSTQIRHRPVDPAAHAKLSAAIRHIPPEKR